MSELELRAAEPVERLDVVASDEQDAAAQEVAADNAGYPGNHDISESPATDADALGGASDRQVPPDRADRAAGDYARHGAVALAEESEPEPLPVADAGADEDNQTKEQLADVVPERPAALEDAAVESELADPDGALDSDRYIADQMAQHEREEAERAGGKLAATQWDEELELARDRLLEEIAARDKTGERDDLDEMLGEIAQDPAALRGYLDSLEVDDQPSEDTAEDVQPSDVGDLADIEAETAEEIGVVAELATAPETEEAVEDDLPEVTGEAAPYLTSDEVAKIQVDVVKAPEIVREVPVFSEADVLAAKGLARGDKFSEEAGADLRSFSMSLEALGGRMVGLTMNSTEEFTGPDGNPIDASWVAKARMTGFLVGFRALQSASGPELPRLADKMVVGFGLRLRQRPETLDTDFERDYGPVTPVEKGSPDRHPAMVGLVNGLSNEHVQYGVKVIAGIFGGWANPGRPSIPLPSGNTPENTRQGTQRGTRRQLEAMQGRGHRRR